jgi:hypothetical protein
VSTTSKGMVQVSGTTYRIVEKSSLHEVVRILDDRVVGSFCFGFESEPRVLGSEIPRRALVAMAQRAHRSARLSWPPRRARAERWFVALLQRAAAGRQQALATFAWVLRGPRLQPIPVQVDPFGGPMLQKWTRSKALAPGAGRH